MAMTIQGTNPLPYSLEAEEAVIGSILLEPSLIGKVIGVIKPDDFFDFECRGIYSVMADIKNQKQEPTEVAITSALNACGYKLNVMQPGKTPFIITISIGFLKHILSTARNPGDIEHYAAEMRKFVFYRHITEMSSAMAKDAISANQDMAKLLDSYDDMLDNLRHKIAPTSRRLELGSPRLIQTEPPRYIWRVNGKDLRLTLSEITMWGKFKNRVIADLNFVPERPKDWDETINHLITNSFQLEAPIDANEEQQLKIIIQNWFDRRREATAVSDLRAGNHVIREIKGINFYFFQSTPLLEYLKKEYKQSINSGYLWDLVDKWGGIRHQIRIKAGDGSMGNKLWGLPLTFADEKKDPPPQQKMPEDF